MFPFLTSLLLPIHLYYVLPPPHIYYIYFFVVWDKRIVGATGTAEQVKQAAKAYRVYYSRGPSEPDDPNDYNIDHTVVFYLMDPEGEFVKHYTSNLSAEEVGDAIVSVLKSADRK